MPPSAEVTSVQDGLEPLLKFAAIFGAGDQGAEIEREQLFILQALRYVAVDDAQRQTLDDRGLADARLADQHRVILGTARQDLNGTADFLVAADDRIELAVACGLRQVAGIFLQRVIGVFGRGGVGGAAFAQGFDGGIEVLRRDAGLGENFSSVAVLLNCQRQQQPFDGNETVAGLLAGLFGGVEHAGQTRCQINLAGTAAGDFRNLRQRRFDCLQCLAGITAGTVDQSGRQPFRVIEQDFEQMFRGELLVTLAQGHGLRGLDEALARGRCIFRNSCLNSFGP